MANRKYIAFGFISTMLSHKVSHNFRYVYLKSWLPLMFLFTPSLSKVSKFFSKLYFIYFSDKQYKEGYC